MIGERREELERNSLCEGVVVCSSQGGVCDWRKNVSHGTVAILKWSVLVRTHCIVYEERGHGCEQKAVACVRMGNHISWHDVRDMSPPELAGLVRGQPRKQN